jgi:hypothetical protein
MWKASAGHKINDPLVKQIEALNSNDPDDWETDPDFVVKNKSPIFYSLYRKKENFFC